MKPCPYCSYLLQDEEIECSYCGESICAEEEGFDKPTKQDFRTFGQYEAAPRTHIAKAGRHVAKSRAKKKRKKREKLDFRKIVLLSIPVLAIFILLIAVNRRTSPPWGPESKTVHSVAKRRPEKSGPVKADSSPRPTLGYEIVKKQDYSYKDTPRMLFRIVLSTDELPYDEDVRATVTEFCKSQIEGHREITAFVYLPGMNTDGQAYAAAEYIPSGLKSYRAFPESLIGTAWEHKAEMRGEAIGRIAAKARQKLEAQVVSIDLSLEMKKKIYREFINDPLWASDDGSDRVALQLGEKYMKRYSLSRNQLALILAEGTEKAW